MRPAAAALVVVALLAPASAGATTRYVSPAGADDGTCTRAAPCSVARAVNGDGSAAGDTVVFVAGVYAGQPLTLARPLTLTAPAAARRPVLRAGAPDTATLTIGAGAAGTRIEHLVIRATGAATAVEIADTAALDDVVVSSATGACLHSAGRGLRIDDSSFVQTGTTDVPCLESTGGDAAWTGVAVSSLNGTLAARFEGNGTVTDTTLEGGAVGLALAGRPAVHRVTAIGVAYGLDLSGNARVTDSVAVARGSGGSAVHAANGGHQLLNVTAYGSARGSYGIRATSGAAITVTNTIARGRRADLSADPATTTIGADCLAFEGCPAGQITADHSNYVTGPGVTDGGQNQAVVPRFADAAFEDFHLRRASPAVDAGSFEFNSGSADRDGRYRWLGAAPDIGAYEYAPPRPRRPRTDTVAPRLARVVLSPSRFAVSRDGSAFSAARGPAAGTALSFHVSEDADLVLTVARPGRGRPVIGTLVRPFRRGPHRMTISGELDRHFLAPGRYVLTAIARDTVQNLSRPRRRAFTIVP